MSEQTTVIHPFANLRFRQPWRPYQQRVLDAVEQHAANRRIHIVAAPGAGKTVLGLEIVRRLGRPALVLSPTIAIRDQWIDRLRDFLSDPSREKPAWVSVDLDDLRSVTSITYQSLHSRHRADQQISPVEESEDPLEDVPGPSEMESVARRLEQARVGTLVLDEAHHLRQEWWKALAALLDAIPTLRLVALTATPPYDVTGREWSRYEELCGPIDEEVSVPELVKSGTLCPHQDYIWAVEPGPQEVSDSLRHDRAVTSLLDDLLSDSLFHSAVLAHPWLAAPKLDEAAVLDDPEQAIALLAYLKGRASGSHPALMDLLDLRQQDVPQPNRRWWAVLLHRYLFDEAWMPSADSEDHRQSLKRRLRDAGLLWRQRLRLEAPDPLGGLLSQSPRKIAACVAICSLERRIRGGDLRQAFLTDFIRDGDQATNEGAPRLGAWPLFRALLESDANRNRTDVAMLTGRLTLIHQSHVEALAECMGADAARLSTEAADCEGYVRVTSPPAGQLVAHLTALFGEGRIRVLVGTRALLGEGWDAPRLNSLVLASYVGSFMLTNQMRGRAIRSAKQDPQKQASIWHLVAVDATTPFGHSDFESLRDRFRTFVGISAGGFVIESGLDRLAIPRPSADGWHQRVNQEMERRLQDSGNLRELWQQAIDGGGEGCVAPSVDVIHPPTLRQSLIAETLKHLFVLAAAAFLFGFSRFADSWHHVRGWKPLLLLLAIASAAGIVLAGRTLLKATVLLLRSLPVDGSLRQMARALLEAMARTGMIETNLNRLEVRVHTLPDQRVSIALNGGTYYERSLFADAFAEILRPIENPKYLMTREGSLLWRRRDYHAVPAVLGANKELASSLHFAWQRRLGNSELVYTRNRDGRRILLRARARAFSAAFASEAERSNRWV